MVQPPKQPVEPGAQVPPPPEPLSQQFPRVKSLRMEVEFFDASGARIQRRCRQLLPDTPAAFDMKCPLDSTPLDLRPIVARMVSGRVKDRADQILCSGSRAGEQHSISYEITIQYLTKGR